MFSEHLYRDVLLAPAMAGANELKIVSGYASASMAHRHLNDEEILNRGVKVQLVYGMAKADGVSLIDNSMFRQLQQGGRFQCNYRIDRPAIHAKVYVWSSDGTPTKAFIGSANYTQKGFIAPDQRQEAMAETDPGLADAFFEEALRGSLEIDHADVDQHIAMFSPKQAIPDRDRVTVSLLTSNGLVPARSGLNWGQRAGRQRDQAYLSVPRKIALQKFFPSRGTQFTVLTDDGLPLMAVVAQDGDKAIETPDGNHILGQYFRRRIGVPLGSFVTRQDLDAYGRTSVEFTKLDDETYLMDFSVQD